MRVGPLARDEAGRLTGSVRANRRLDVIHQWAILAQAQGKRVLSIPREDMRYIQRRLREQAG